MKRFEFRFQRVLALKETLEEARRAELGAAVAVLNREAEELRRLQEQRRDYRSRSERLPRAVLNPPLLAINTSYLQRLQREIGEQGERLARAQGVVDERRRRLLAATKERRVFEILREKALEAHRREHNRQERIFLDEVGEQLHARRGSVGMGLN